MGIFIPALRGGGAEFVARRWIEELDKLDHRVTVYLYDPNPADTKLPTRVQVRQFRPLARGMRHVQLPIWLNRRLNTDHPDVLLSLMTHGNVVALFTCIILQRAATPLVVSERNMPSLQYSHARGHARLTVWLAKRLYRRAAGVLAISHPVAGDLVSGFGVDPSRLYVVQNPVMAASQSKQTPRRQPPPRLHLAYVGRLVEQKRPSLFLAVLGEVARLGVAVRATMFGDGPLRRLVEDEAAELGLSVSFAGWKEPWWESATDVDCVVLTAGFEGLANVLIEATAAGIPTVASSRALGVADAIVPGLTGELAMSDDPPAYAAAILRACTGPWDTNKPIDGWLEHFSTERSTSRLLEALATARREARSQGAR